MEVGVELGLERLDLLQAVVGRSLDGGDVVERKRRNGRDWQRASAQEPSDGQSAVGRVGTGVYTYQCGRQCSSQSCCVRARRAVAGVPKSRSRGRRAKSRPALGDSRKGGSLSLSLSTSLSTLAGWATGMRGRPIARRGPRQRGCEGTATCEGVAG